MARPGGGDDQGQRAARGGGCAPQQREGERICPARGHGVIRAKNQHAPVPRILTQEHPRDGVGGEVVVHRENRAF